MRGFRCVRSAAAIGAAALVLFSGFTGSVYAQQAAPAVAHAASGAGDALWHAARIGDWAAFDKALDAAANGDHPALKDAAASLKGHLADREVARGKRLGEAREEFAKALAGETTDITLSKALRSATELQVLSIDKPAFMAETQVKELIIRAKKAAMEAEARGDFFTAYEQFSLLGALLEESGEYKHDVRRLSQRLDMLRLYVPETLWRLRNERQKASGEKELPPYNAFGDDYKTKLGTIDKAMVMRAVARTTQHVERQPVNVILSGGLEVVRTMITTTDLSGAFPQLADDAARKQMLSVVDAELRSLANTKVDYDVGQLDSLLERLIMANNASTKVASFALLHEFGNGAMSKLDEFSQIIWPDEVRRFNKMTQSSFVGVGIQIEFDETSNVRVVSPLEGTPAQRAGVHPGDVLKKVDGRVIFGLSLDQAVDVITGPAGSDVVLTMTRKFADQKDEKGNPKTEDIDFKLTRAIIKVGSAKGWTRNGVKEDDWNWFIDKDSGIGYVRLTQFAETTGREFDDAIAAMRKQGLNGLIFDLRFDPGGLLDQAIRIARRFIDTPNAYVVAMRGPDGKIVSPEETIPERARLASTPIIVLVNEGSASASEIVSGALKCFQRGGQLDGKLDCLVLGARSFGKGSVQNVWGLTADSMMKVTTQYYVIPNGTILHRRPGSETWGVEPNLKVEMLPKQTVEAVLLRRNADVVALDENGKIMETASTPHADPQDLLTKGTDLQLETALLLMKSKVASGAAAQAAAKEPR